MTEELETLESIAEDIKSSIPNAIDEVYVNMKPQSMEIKEIIDIRHIRPSRQTFYLARAIEGRYY